MPLTTIGVWTGQLDAQNARSSGGPMAAEKMMVKEFAWNPRYAISGIDEILTPALVLYPDVMARNIQRTIAILNGDASRWRPHIKTAKLAYTLRMFVEYGVRSFKCATTLELLVACRTGAQDVLVAYPLIGANARRVREISEEFPHVKISILTESAEQLAQWKGSRIGAFIDLNPGMNRTGIGETHVGEVVELVNAIKASGLEFRGLHYYDGQFASTEEPERTRRTHEGYWHLLTIVEACEKDGTKVAEVITSGTPVFRSAISFQGFVGRDFVHRVSPGTIVYSDATSLAQLADERDYQPAVLVLTRVVSHPRAGMATCDAGHKAVSA